MSENDELLARISHLAGQINQHKNQGPGHRGGYHSHPRHHVGWAPYRGRGRPYRRTHGQHRHRTLVLNNATNSDPATASPSDVSNDDASDAKPAQQGGWITKRDRHMQLINPAIYDQETQARAKAMAETRKLRAQKKAEREQAKVMRHAHAVGPDNAGASSSIAPPPPASYQIVVQGIPFQVAQAGSKLIRIASETHIDQDLRRGYGLPSIGEPFAANTTPKKAIVGGVTFVRSKNGNLYRLGAVVSKKCVLPCQKGESRRDREVQLTVELRKPRVTKKDELCKRFTSTGSCFKGPNCPYIHDPSKVAICKDFLQTGNCSAGQACDLSHDPSPERSPACVHFIRGRCTNPVCRYAHVRVNPGAPVCRDFAILGYCGKGAQCFERHVHECPDYANTGQCGNKKCTLPHIDRAGQIRKLATNKSGNDRNSGDDEEDESDLSSEEEEYDEIDSDDVDSDDLDEPEEILQGLDSTDIAQQQDFIRF